MKRPNRDPDREDRIHNEVIADANGPEEQVMGWHCYLDDNIRLLILTTRPPKPSPTGIIGWHKATASDLRTPAESSRSALSGSPSGRSLD